MAIAHHPQAMIAGVDVRLAKAVAAQADAARSRPQLELTQMFGPSPAANGSPYDSTLRSDLGDLGAFTRTEATLVFPLYTFGKLSGLSEAGHYAVDAASGGEKRVAAEIRRDIKKAYYGILLARELKSLADEALRRVDQARARVQALIEEQDLQPSDRYRLDVFSSEIEARRATAAFAEESLKDAMKSSIGLVPAASFDIEDEMLEKAGGVRPGADESKNAALRSRPELVQLRAGVAARSALVRSARAELYPQFYIGTQLRYGYAPNRSDQKNPFVRDDFNFLQGGFAIGFRYSLNFSLARAKAEQARAERDKTVAQLRAAEEAIGLQARNAARAVQADSLAAGIRERAAKVARGWAAAAESNFELGIGETRDLVDAFQAYIQTKTALLQALFEDNVARAELEYAEGRP